MLTGQHINNFMLSCSKKTCGGFAGLSVKVWLSSFSYMEVLFSLAAFSCDLIFRIPAPNSSNSPSSTLSGNSNCSPGVTSGGRMIAPPPGTSAGHHVGPPQGSGTNSHQGGWSATGGTLSYPAAQNMGPGK